MISGDAVLWVGGAIVLGLLAVMGICALISAPRDDDDHDDEGR